MRHLLPGLACLLAFAFSLDAGVLPLTVKEISLMLRSGYSAQDVENDLARRHFIETIDPAAEKTLLLAGASPDLLHRLKGGFYAVPAEKTAALRREMEAKAARRAALQEEAKKSNSLYQDQLARERAAAASIATTRAPIANLVKGDLVTSKNGILNTYNDQELGKKKLVALFFSARWCPSCRRFTPELVQYYNRVAAAHPDFEVIFVSLDRSAPAMEAYMRDMQMPWPAVRFDKVQEKKDLLAYVGPGIPCLVLVDAGGNVLSDSYNGTTYVGPNKVLADLDRYFGAAPPEAVAQAK